MSASLSDILTTQKNGVIAINNLASYLLGVYNNITTVQLCQLGLTTKIQMNTELKLQTVDSLLVYLNT